MVPVSLETSLPARNFAKKLLSTSSAFALEPCSQSLEFDTVALNLATAKELPIACYGNMVYSDINTNLKSVRNLVDVNVSGKCNVKEHSIVLINSNFHSLITQIKVLPIIFRNFDRDINSTFDCCYSNFIRTKGKCSLVKVKGHIFFKDWIRTFVSLNTFKSLRSNTIGVYDELRGKLELVSSFIITKMVKLVSVINIRFKAFISNIRDSLRVLLHSIEKQFVHRDSNLYSDNRLHIGCKLEQVFKTIGGEFAFLPTINGLGIQANTIL